MIMFHNGNKIYHIDAMHGVVFLFNTLFKDIGTSRISAQGRTSIRIALYTKVLFTS